MVITKLIKAQPAFTELNIQEVRKAKEAHEEHFADEDNNSKESARGSQNYKLFM